MLTLVTLTGLTGIILTATTVPSASLPSRADDVLYERTNVEGTAYYDIRQTPTHDLCGRMPGNEDAPFPAMWSETTGYSDGTTMCESKMPGGTAPTYKQMDSDHIVAIDASMIQGDLSAWCGKEVKIFKNGKEFKLDDQPFVLWEGCPACSGGTIIDMSAQAMVGLSDDGKCRDNPTGLTYQILNNQIWQPATDGNWRPTQSAGGDSTTTAAAVEIPAAASTTSQSTSQSTIKSNALSFGDKTASGGKCGTKGDWSCDGLALRMCDYVASGDLGWKVLNPACFTYCDITRQPNCG